MAYPVRYFCCRSVSDEEMERIFCDKSGFLAGAEKLAGPVRGETGVPGLRLDFNNGLRLDVPEGAYHVRIGDADAGLVFFDEDVSGVRLQSKEKFFVRWQVEVYHGGAVVFSHICDPTGQTVFIVDGTTALGDTLAMLPYLPALQERYHARIACFVPEYLRGFVHRLLPQIELQEAWPDDAYATFFFGAPKDAPAYSPEDGRMIPMEDYGRQIFGVPRPERLPEWTPQPQKITEPYVCIGVQASDPAKGWLYPGGWEVVVDALLAAGYRVLCIDRDREATGHGFTSRMPANAEDFTGARPIEERADLLAHAAFFIGLSSGLSWLAHAVGCPVVMICGFSESWHEFATPYRVYNRLACHGCVNDVRVNYFKNPCPRQPRGSDRILECQKTITPRMVLDAIRRLQQDLS